MKKAFTLVELLVVVLIIGILSAIALPQYQKAVWKARFSELLVKTRDIEKAVEIYILANAPLSSTVYPAEELDVDVFAGLTKDGNKYCSKYACYELYCGNSSGISYCQWLAYLYENQTHTSMLVNMGGAYNSGVWERRCYSAEDEPIGKSLCMQVAGLGWDEIDYSGL